ncbi:Uma2 family endonuclease [Myxacorys almedinensis]|uniref:Uma2 family endonuclease n=1 Tax=Myxacorys almedinensis A TaxID=2690445 RepID=A0A8J7Z0L5_9CYAN|nr:Uma2 family endonuclease [Myxacorys almedinensis]NDJ17917.1 Uma2 family endonuclease [Myxacorys almedinensis A]
MTIAVPQPLTLEQFLQLPYIEESPAWEFIQREAVQKPMSGGKHSRLQSRLGAAINAIDSPYEAFSELRCTVGGRSIVPDLVVLAKSQIPMDSNGEIISTGISVAPNWIIEILSPDQSQMKVTRNILHSLRHGGQIGWLIDPDERVVLVYRPDCLPEELTEDTQLPCLPGVDLALTVEQLFGWLRVSGN